MPCSDALDAGTDNSFNINAVMLIETFVFNRYKSVCQMFGYHIHSYRDTVGIFRNQFGCLVAVNIIYESRKTCGLYIDIADFRCGVDNPAEQADTDAGY